jgi:hypothetical protein
VSFARLHGPPRAAAYNGAAMASLARGPLLLTLTVIGSLTVNGCVGPGGGGGSGPSAPGATGEARTFTLASESPVPVPPGNPATPGSSPVPAQPSGPAPSLPATILDPVLADAAARSGLSQDALVVVSAGARTWPDAGLGCPPPGMIFPQVPVDGYQVLVQAGTTTYDYRGSGPGSFRLCEAPPS